MEQKTLLPREHIRSWKVRKMADKSKPIKKFRIGSIEVAVWKNLQKKDGKEFETHGITMQKSYKDNEEWKTTNNFTKIDILKLGVLLQRAYEYIDLTEE